MPLDIKDLLLGGRVNVHLQVVHQRNGHNEAVEGVAVEAVATCQSNTRDTDLWHWNIFKSLIIGAFH